MAHFPTQIIFQCFKDCFCSNCFVFLLDKLKKRIYNSIICSITKSINLIKEPDFMKKSNDSMKIMKKKILLEDSKVLYDRPFSEVSFQEDWKVCTGEWWLEDEWLTGKNPGNFPGMIIAKQDFTGNVLVDFLARTMPPCTHDINFMWNGSWDEEKNQRDVAYVAGLEGWWTGKVGIEKSPEYILNAGTPLYDFEPGKTYHIQGGSIDGHCFVFVDGKLLLEITDPQPIDSAKYTKVGFEAYCSYIQIKDVKIRQIKWEPNIISYVPEF
jgi:hypothetical protein